MDYREIIGYSASFIVAISLMMSSVIKLRVLNLLGSFLFTIYGFLINSLPVGFLNLFICFVNIYYLIKMSKTSIYFSILEVPGDSKYLDRFFLFYQKDINKFFPYFDYKDDQKFKKLQNIHYYFILRDLVPAGIFIIEEKDNFHYIHLDYVIPDYRDFKIAKFLFIENLNFLKENGFSILRTHSGHNLHANYLRKIGFNKIGSDEFGQIYEKNLFE